MNQRMIDFYMRMAEECSRMSRAVRLQVGALIVKNNNIISFSWNGTPAGWDNNCEDIVLDPGAGGWTSPEEFDSMYPFEGKFWINGQEVNARYGLKTKPEVLHAEMNSLMKLAKSSYSGEEASMFITHSPCLECAKGIYQAGIKEVFYKNDYRSKDGVYFLEKCGIKIKRIINE